MSSDLESWYTRLRNLILNSGGRVSGSDYVLNHLPDLTAASQNDASSNLEHDGDMAVSMCGVSGSGWLALHEAAARNDSEVLDFLLQHAGTFVDVLTEEENETPLFLAVKHGHVTAVKQMIKAHASLNIANVDGLTPLSIAVQQDNGEMIVLLLKEEDCDVDHREYHGWAALHEAARQGKKHTIQMLLKRGAEPNILTNLGETPIYIACKYGYVSCVELLLRYNGRANIANSISGQTPLFIAANKNHVDCVSFLINYAADANISNKDGLLPLHTAVWANSIPCLRVLIPVTDKNLLTQYGGMTPVQLAVFRHNVEALQVLIENDFDVNAVASTSPDAVCSPSQSGPSCSSSYTFTHFGSVTNLRLRTPLFLASLWNHESCITLLLNAGADTNTDDPIKYCISNNRVDMCSLLVRYGARIYPRHMFMAKSNEMLQLLLHCGLDPTELFQNCVNSHTEFEHCPLIDDWLIKHFAHPELTIKLVLTLTGNVNKCQRFEQVFPETVLAREPRKLKHLVRIYIRSFFNAQELLQSRAIFSKLRIPDTLQHYLCCPEL